MVRDTSAFQYFVGFDNYYAKLPLDSFKLAKFCQQVTPISELLRKIVIESIREKLITLGVDVSELSIEVICILGVLS